MAREKGTDAKSEVEEVLKGSLNPRLTEKILSVILDSESGEARDFNFFFSKFSSDPSKWVCCSLLMAMYSEDYSRCQEYVKSSLQHPDFLVRECALHVYLQYEIDQKNIHSVCDEMSKDEDLKVAVMATQQLKLA